MKSGDLVRDTGEWNASWSRYEYDEYDEYDYFRTDPPPPINTAVFIEWHIVTGEEEGEFYSCAKVLWSRGGVGNIIRRNVALVSEG